MTSRFLPVVVTNAEFVIARSAPLLLSGSFDLHRALGFCREYRRRGIANFLMTCDPLRLHNDLQCSGGAYAAYLEKLDDSRKIFSKSSPLFDAIACNDISMARLICSRGQSRWQPDEEYEDDYLYFSLIAGRFFRGESADTVMAALKRYETVLDGAPDPRYAICLALVQRRPDDFEAALQQLIEQREDEYALGIDADQILEEDWSTDGKVFVEGIALVRLARAVGLDVQDQYLFVPDVAVNAAAASFAAHRWRDL